MPRDANIAPGAKMTKAKSGCGAEPVVRTIKAAAGNADPGLVSAVSSGEPSENGRFECRETGQYRAGRLTLTDLDRRGVGHGSGQPRVGLIQANCSKPGTSQAGPVSRRCGKRLGGSNRLPTKEIRLGTDGGRALIVRSPRPRIMGEIHFLAGMSSGGFCCHDPEHIECRMDREVREKGVCYPVDGCVRVWGTRPGDRIRSAVAAVSVKDRNLWMFKLQCSVMRPPITVAS